MKRLILFGMSIILVISSLAEAIPQVPSQCRQVHTGQFIQVYERIQRQTLSSTRLDRSKEGLPYDSQVGGLIQFNEKAFSPEVAEGVAEVLRMYVASNKPYLKRHNKNSKIESMTLGLPLGYGYSIELTYIAQEGQRPLGDLGDSATPFRGLYLDENAHIVAAPPSTIRSKLPLRITKRNGVTLSEKMFREGPLKDIPELRGFNFNIDIPVAIEGAVLEKIEYLAERLEYYPFKAELLPFIQDGSPESLAKLEKVLFVEEQKDMSGRYLHRGVHKWTPKILQGIIGSVVVVAALVAGKTFFPETAYDLSRTAQRVFTVSADEVAVSMLRSWSNKSSLPLDVRKDLVTVEQFVREEARKAKLVGYLDQFPADINQTGKFSVEQARYIWFETRLDKVKNQPVEVMYMAKLGSDSQYVIFAIPVDPNRIPHLYQFTKNRGQFVVSGDQP